MLDTIGIRTIPGEFIINGNAELEVYPARYSLNDGEVKNEFYLFDLNGEDITGSKAILNRENYQVTIDARGLYTQLSVPKYARGSNYRLSDKREATEVMKDLERSLNDEGIKLNILDAIPGRLDGCKNVSLNNPTGNYLSFMQNLNGSRMKSNSGYSNGIKRTGHQWSNTRQEIICYDKRLEMQSRKAPVTGLPKNVLRFEHRLRNGKKIKDALGFHTVKDLINNFGDIEQNYNKVLRESIFKYDADDKRLFSSKTIEQYLYHSLINYKRSKFQRFAVDILFSKENLIIDEQSLFEMLETAMENANYKSGLKRIHRFRLKQMLDATKEIAIDVNQVNVRELYNELKGKLLRAA